MLFVSQEKAESSANLRKEKIAYSNSQLVPFPESYYPMRNSRVCITPTPSVIYMDKENDTVQCNCHRRSSLPNFYSKSSHVLDSSHQSAPATPSNLSPQTPRKTQSMSEEPGLVLTNPQMTKETAWYEKNGSDTDAEVTCRGLFTGRFYFKDTMGFIMTNNRTHRLNHWLLMYSCGFGLNQKASKIFFFIWYKAVVNFL